VSKTNVKISQKDNSGNDARFYTIKFYQNAAGSISKQGERLILLMNNPKLV